MASNGNAALCQLLFTCFNYVEVHITIENGSKYGGSIKDYCLKKGSGWSAKPSDLPENGGSTVAVVSRTIHAQKTRCELKLQAYAYDGGDLEGSLVCAFTGQGDFTLKFRLDEGSSFTSSPTSIRHVHVETSKDAAGHVLNAKAVFYDP